MAKKVKCPVCKESFELEEGLEADDTIDCPGCYEELTIVSLEPLSVEASSAGDDYYESDEDGEDDYGKRKGKEEWS